jgi:peroxiredoxin
MKTGVSILAGLLAGVVVAVGILAAFVFVGPDPVGLRPTPAPTLIPSASIAPSPSIAASPSVAPSASVAVSPSGAPIGSADAGLTARIGQPAPALVVPQVGGGTIDLAGMKGQAVWLTFVQTTCAPCADSIPLLDDVTARYADAGLAVIAIDVREAEAAVATFAAERKATFAFGLDPDGTVQEAWGTSTLPTHVWIDKDGIVRAALPGGTDVTALAAGLQTVLPGATVAPSGAPSGAP